MPQKTKKSPKREEKKSIIRKFSRVLLVAGIAFLIGELLFIFLERSQAFSHSIFSSIVYAGFLIIVHPIFYCLVKRQIKMKLIFYVWAVLIIVGLMLGIHLFGGVENFVAITYVAVIVVAYYIFSFRDGLIITSLASLSYAGVLGLEHFEIIPHLSIWGLEKDFHFKGQLVLGAAFFNILAFYAIGLLAGQLTKMTEKAEEEKRLLVEEISHRLEEEVKRKTKELREAKAVLEVRVKARTRELEELTQGLEDKVKQRTKELQERVNELEKFHKLTVGRELKMIELKREIEKLRLKKKSKGRE